MGLVPAAARQALGLGSEKSRHWSAVLGDGASETPPSREASQQSGGDLTLGLAPRYGRMLAEAPPKQATQRAGQVQQDADLFCPQATGDTGGADTSSQVCAFEPFCTHLQSSGVSVLDVYVCRCWYWNLALVLLLVLELGAGMVYVAVGWYLEEFLAPLVGWYLEEFFGAGMVYVNAELRVHVADLSKKVQEYEEARIMDREEMKRTQSDMEAKLNLLLSQIRPS